MKTKSCILCALLVLALLSACGDDGVTLSVRVATGLVPGPEFSSATSELFENTPAIESARSLRQQVTVAAFGQPYARGYVVADFPGVPPGTYIVRVTLHRPNGTDLIQRKMRVTIADNYILTMALTRDCVDVVCPSPGGSAAFSECLAGRCVSPDCNPPTDSEACGEVVFCNQASECAETSSCAERNCFEGICHPQPIENACSDTQWCDPDVGDGCVPYPRVDAGVPDAGMPDAGDDADVIACGRTCTPTDDPCSGGYWDCTAETPVCARIGQRPVGTICADGRACNAAGECVVCRDGAACRIGCQTGVVSCASGIEECVLNAPNTYAPALASCAFGTQCVDEDSCGTGDVCTSAGECVACREGDACNDGCALGTLSCDTGTCTLSGSYLPTGAYCGASSYCAADHTCGPCVEESACVPTLACWDGEMSGCGATPRCLLVAPSAPGTDCATGVCSGTGSCVEGLRVVDTAVGGQHTCALLEDHSVVCFGDNTYGTLATGDTAAVSLLRRVVVPLANVESISSGYNFSCAVTMAGELWCWGYDWGVILSSEDFTTTPVRITLPGPVRQVVNGYSDTCVLLDSGEVWCAGYYYHGAPADPSDLGFVHMPGVDNTVQIAGSYLAVCARLDTGRVKCWGNDDTGQLGDGRTMVGEMSNPVDVVGIDDAVDVSMGDTHGCAVRADASLWCWGSGGTVIHQMTVPEEGGVLPHEIMLPFDGVARVEASWGRSCVLATDGQLWCWGTNYLGATGTGSTADSVDVPSRVVGLSRVEHLPRLGFGAGGCAVQDGYAVCWGPNSWGEVGDGTTSPHPSPVLVLRGMP